MSIVSTSGNLLSILYISVDRYIYIAYPLRYDTLITQTKTFIVLAITWAYFIFAIPLIMAFTHHLEVGITCKYVLFLHPIVYYCFFTPELLILIVLTIGFYIAIARIAHKQSNAIAASTVPVTSVGTLASQKSKKIAKMLGAILGVYLLTIMPQYIMTLLIGSKKSEFFLKMEKVTVLIYWANTWVNPIIYVLKVKEFQSPLKKLLNLA